MLGAGVAEPAAGAVVANRFRLERLIGKGGMGAVYLARHLTLDAPCAVKLLDPTGNREVHSRFVQEARVSARLKSPHVVRVIDTGEWEGRLYLAMEYLEGEDLRNRLEHTGVLTTTELVKVIRQVCDALAEAHRVGIVHRDIKPGNIFLSKAAGGGETVKVLDFGIAKLVGSEPKEMSTTQTGALLGSPLYMSPEQVRGKKEVDARSDLWSLAMVVFEAITGRRAVEGESIADVVVRIVNEALPAPSVFRAGLPASFDAWWMRASDRDPSRRFQTATEFGEELARALQGVADALLAPPASAANADVAPSTATTQDTVVTTGAGARNAAHDPWSSLAAALPLGLRGAEMPIRKLLEPWFSSTLPVSGSVVRLEGPRRADTRGIQCFAVFMGTEVRGAAEVGIRTFMSYVEPLERHLERLDADARKLVVVVTESATLGRGVRQRIAEYQERYRAVVVPFFISEVRKATSDGRVVELLGERLLDLHARPNLFMRNRRRIDATRIIGLDQQTGDFVSVLREPGGAVLLSGGPGSGKSALVAMAEYGLEKTKFVRVECAHVSPSTASTVAIELLSHLGVECNAPGNALEMLRKELTGFKPGERPSGPQLVVVLEDADWLIDAIAPTLPEHADARALWTLLSKAVKARCMSLVVTALATGVLAERRPYDWPNPVAQLAVPHEIPPLSKQSAGRLVRELGFGCNLRFEDAAIDELHAQSGGNVEVLLRVCARVVDAVRSRDQDHSLVSLNVGLEAVQRAVEALVADSTSLRGGALDVLHTADRRVLRAIAIYHPSSVDKLRSLLESLPPSDVDRRLERLKQMGLVVTQERGESITIPVLAAWLARHREHTPPRNLFGPVAMAAGLAILGVSFYLVMQGSEPALAQLPYYGCQLTLTTHKRQADGELIKIHAHEEGCEPKDVPQGVRLAVSGRDEEVDIQGEPSPTVRCDGDVCNADITLKAQFSYSSLPLLVKVTGDPANKSRIGLTIERDPTAVLKRRAGQVLAYGSGALTIIGTYLAFQRRLRSLLRELRALLRRPAGLEPAEDPER